MPTYLPRFNRRSAARAALLVAALAAPARSARAQECDGVRAGRVGAIAAVYGAGEATALVLRHDDWWPDPARGFHIEWGGSASAGQDALLHATIAYHTAQLATLAWDWACVPPRTAAWLGSLAGVAVALPKEIGDGFHATGFSGTDMVWTTVGALLPGLRRTWTPAAALAVKVTYWPSAEYRSRKGRLPQLETDYAGQRFYLTASPGLVPGGAGPWPDWLGVAVGHSVPQWVSAPPTHEWYATLDINFRGLPIRTTWWRTLATALDQVHFPTPGIRITSGQVKAGMF